MPSCNTVSILCSNQRWLLVLYTNDKVSKAMPGLKAAVPLLTWDTCDLLRLNPHQEADVPFLALVQQQTNHYSLAGCLLQTALAEISRSCSFAAAAFIQAATLRLQMVHLLHGPSRKQNAKLNS